MTRVSNRFTDLQRSLHWLMAACILAMLFIGVGMNSTVMPNMYRFWQHIKHWALSSSSWR